jgi:chemotaxis methyl-accepting protein methylase
MLREPRARLHGLLADQGLDASVYEDTFFQKAVESRCAALGGIPFAEYVRIVSDDPAELARFTACLHIGYSEFFRSPLTFACLETLVLPFIIKRKAQNQEGGVRIWSAACAEGQAAYSVAMLCDELMRQASAAPDAVPGYQVFGTDIDERALQTARTGTYTVSALGKVTLKRSEACFLRQGESYTVVQRIRDAVDFSAFDLVTEQGLCPPISIYGSFDLVFCCNLLFYYKPHVQDRILEKLGSCLAPGSCLVTGDAERDIVARHHFREVYPGSAIFKPEHEGGLS